MISKKILKKWETKFRRYQESKTEVTEPGRILTEKSESVYSSTTETEMTVERNLVERQRTDFGVQPVQFEMGRKGKDGSSTYFLSAGDFNMSLETPSSEVSRNESLTGDDIQEKNGDDIFTFLPFVGDSSDSVSQRCNHKKDNTELNTINCGSNTKTKSDQPDAITKEIQTGVSKCGSCTKSKSDQKIAITKEIQTEVSKLDDDKEDLWNTDLGIDKTLPESKMNANDFTDNCNMNVKSEDEKDNIKFENSEHVINIRMKDASDNTIAESFNIRDISEVSNLKNKEDTWKLNVVFNNDIPESRISNCNSSGNSNVNFLGDKPEMNNIHEQSQSNFITKTDDDSTVKRPRNLSHKDMSVRSKIPIRNATIKHCSEQPQKAVVSDVGEDFVTDESQEINHEHTIRKDFADTHKKECFCRRSDELEKCDKIDKEDLRRSVNYLINYYESLKNSNTKQLNSLTQMAKAIDTSDINTCKIVNESREEPIKHSPTKRLRSLSENSACRIIKAKKRFRDRSRSSSRGTKKCPKEDIPCCSSTDLSPPFSSTLPYKCCSHDNLALLGSKSEHGINNNMDLKKQSQFLIPESYFYNPTITKNRFCMLSSNASMDAAKKIPPMKKMVLFSAKPANELTSKSGISNMMAPKNCGYVNTGNRGEPVTVEEGDYSRFTKSMNNPLIRNLVDGHSISKKINNKMGKKINDEINQVNRRKAQRNITLVVICCSILALAFYHKQLDVNLWWKNFFKF